MMNFISFLTNTSCPEHIVMNLEKSLNVPFHVYWKDVDGKYVHCNELQARDAGFTKIEDMLGKTDLDLPGLSNNDALSFIRNDEKIIKTNSPQIFIEPFSILPKRKVVAISHKVPFRMHTKKIMGIMGFSPIFEQNANLNSILLSLDLVNHYHLTKMELQIVNYLIRGKTAKMIANLLGSSVRTVEHHLKNIKLKVGVSSKPDLIEKILNSLGIPEK